MATEGQTATGPNGQRAVFTGGRWVVQGGAQMPVNPEYPFKGIKAGADATNATVNADVNEATRDAQIRKILAEAEAAERAGQKEAASRGDTDFDNASSLRKEFRSSPNYLRYDVALGTLNSALGTQANAQGDQSLITSYAKMLDPDSAVREGEFATTANTEAYIQQVKAKLAKQFGFDGGGMLSKEGREFVRLEMKNLVENRFRPAYERDRRDFMGYAEAYGFAPEVIVGSDPYKEYGKGFDEYWAKAPKEEEGLTGAVSDDTPSPYDPGGELSVKPDNYRDSYAGQGLSGVNEGIASVLGGPVDLATVALNAVPQGLNAATGSQIPTIQDPLLGSQWFKDRMDGWGIYGQTNDPSKQFARRVGESLGAGIAPAAAAGSVPRLASTLLGSLGGGVGAATAEQAFPGNPLAEFAGEVAGGGLSAAGLARMGQRRAQSVLESQVPTTQQLREQAGELYRAAEARGVTASPQQTIDLADQMRATLRSEGRVSPTGRISEVYPKAKEAMQLVDDYSGQPMNPTQMQTVRGVVADGLMSKDANERRIARSLTDSFDDWANPMAPELPQARDVASRYLTAEQLERARELAGARAGQFSGSGFENALRTEYRALDRGAITGSKRFGDDVTAAIENVSRGTPGSNLARGIGKLAPRGVVSGMLGTGGPAILGGVLGGGPGAAALGGGAMALGEIGRAAATRMGIRGADLAEITARNGGALPNVPLLSEEEKRIVTLNVAAQLAKYLNRDEESGAQSGGSGQNPQALAPGYGGAMPKLRGLFGAPSQ